MTDRSDTIRAPDFEAIFALSEGHVSRGLERLRLARGAHLRSGRVAVLLAAVTWLPLLVLAALEGVAWGSAIQVPLVRDFLPYGQLLIAVPVLVLGQATLGRYLTLAVAELRTSEILDPEDKPILDEVLESTVERWRGRSVDLVLLGLVLAAVLPFLPLIFLVMPAREVLQTLARLLV